MAISLVDQQVADDTRTLLNYLLSNSYIIKQDILGQLPTDIADSFIDTYCRDHGHKGKEIPVYFAFPNTPPRTAFMLIQFKGSEEDEDSSVLGGIEGQTIDNEVGTLIHEKLPVQVGYQDNQQVAYIEPSKSINSVRSIPQVSNYQLQGNKVIVPYLPMLDKEKVYLDLYYNEKLDQTGKHTPVGINTKEGVTIDFIASNTNTIRCLGAILTYIRVYLKQSLDENGTVYLPETEMNGMDIIADQQANQVAGQTLYYRRLQVTYHVTQAISQGASQVIKEINLEEED